MNSSNVNYKISKITYDEYMKFSDCYEHVLKQEVFESYQNKEKAPKQFYKMRVDFDIIYFDISNSSLCFINKDIYTYNFKIVQNIFESIAALGINQSICFYTPFKNVMKGKISDYLDNTDTKVKFIDKYGKYFLRQEYKTVYEVKTKTNIDIKDEIIIKEKNNKLICSNDDKTFNISFELHDDELFLSEIAYDRIIEDSKNKGTNPDDYFLFVEKSIFCLKNNYKKIYTTANKDFKYENYFENIKYVKKENIYQYFI